MVFSRRRLARMLGRKRLSGNPQPGEFLRWLAKRNPGGALVYEKIVRMMTESRQEAGLTRTQLADMVGTTEQAIINFETCAAQPCEHVFARLKQVLMITIVTGDLSSQIPQTPDGKPVAVYDLRASANYGEGSW
ncbi:MAG TPA: hypothetical protein V6D22_14045 [Candidatus Obscuribacterales bacterium]